MAEASYDVYAFDGQRWSMERNFVANEQKDAIAFAEDIYRSKQIIGVRVVMETRDPATGDTRDRTVFKKEKQPITMKGPGGGAGAGAGGRTVDMAGAAGAPSAGPGRGQPAAAGGGVQAAFGHDQINISRLLTKASAAAAGAGIIAVVVHIVLSQFMGARGYAGAVTGVALLIFGVSYASLSWFLLNPAEIQQIMRFALGLRPSSALDLGPAHVVMSPPLMAVPPAARPSVETAPSIVMEEPADQPAADPLGDFEIEHHRLHLLQDDTKALVTFLHDALKAPGELGKHLVGGKLDSYNSFGCHMFLAGACESFGRAVGRSKNEIRWALAHALSGIFGEDTSAKNFAENYEEYLMQPKYLDMFKSGADAMEGRRADAAAAGPPLAAALDRWNDRSERKTTDYAVVMFTDMVGSTEHTQTHGDEAQYELVKTHNAIVRQALGDNSGREIKHTGDGIMAAFTSAFDGVVCAIQIQRAIATHNTQRPELPIGLRIGLNAGEPIKEGADLFGSTVQLAARVCAQAEAGQIVISYIVQGLCAARNLSFANLGARELKGFKEPVEIYRVLWE
jgi:class 3 adenylate cyclase